MKIVQIDELFETQREKLQSVLSEHPEAIVIRCGDENTGERFGKSAKRQGLCQKIGSGGRNKGFKCPAYQVWASWAPADMKFAKVQS